MEDTERNTKEEGRRTTDGTAEVEPAA